MSFVAAALHAHAGSFIGGGGFTLLTALEVIWDNQCGRKDATSIEGLRNEMKEEIRKIERGMKGGMEER